MTEKGQHSMQKTDEYDKADKDYDEEYKEEVKDE